ncbi:hypothetical protein BRARA_F02715 [Brassica rapa]|uniref:Cytochrome P450 n=1 Tax=Brassica campestris TaxID=3711 RepID=A0A397Z7Z3_BRACM|nr:hypothetical protein BRARA_F02715 [Brassica rapa]
MSMLYIIVAIIFFASLLAAKNTRKTKKNLPPGPPRLPIIGNLHQLGSKPHRSMLKLSEEYGSLMSLRFGNVSTVVASSPETVKDVLKTFDADCCSRPYLTYAARLSHNLNDLAFSPYSKYWREVRKMTVLELYTAKRVKSFRHIREEEVVSFIDFLKQSASLANPVNLNKKLMKLSGSVICRVGFGMNLKGSKLENTYEEKTWIHVNIWAVQRNPNVWKDPEAFIPERFMDNEIDYKGLDFELLPFGSGRRMCPGIGMGMALVNLTLTNLLYRFDWKLPDGMDAKDVDLEESYGLVCPKKVPLQLIPILTQWT